MDLELRPTSQHRQSLFQAVTNRLWVMPERPVLLPQVVDNALEMVMLWAACPVPMRLSPRQRRHPGLSSSSGRIRCLVPAHRLQQGLGLGGRLESSRHRS